MVVNFWRLALLIISNVCSGLCNSWNSMQNNSRFVVVTMRSLARDPRNIEDLSSRTIGCEMSCDILWNS